MTKLYELKHYITYLGKKINNSYLPNSAPCEYLIIYHIVF